MPFGAAIAAAGAIGGALITSGGAQSAADTQAQAANNATAVQQSMFNTTQSNLAPFLQSGTNALPALLAMLGFNNTGVTVPPSVAFPAQQVQAQPVNVNLGNGQTVGSGPFNNLPSSAPNMAPGSGIGFAGGAGNLTPQQLGIVPASGFSTLPPMMSPSAAGPAPSNAMTALNASPTPTAINPTPVQTSAPPNNAAPSQPGQSGVTPSATPGVGYPPGVTPAMVQKAMGYPLISKDGTSRNEALANLGLTFQQAVLLTAGAQNVPNAYGQPLSTIVSNFSQGLPSTSPTPTPTTGTTGQQAGTTPFGTAPGTPSTLSQGPLTTPYQQVAGPPPSPTGAPQFNEPAFTKDMFQSSPGYQFQLQQGIEALGNKASVTGSPSGGNALKDLMTFGQGLANQDWWNAYNAYNQQYTNTYNAANQNYWNAYDAANQNYWAGQAAYTQNQGQVYNMLAALTGSGQNAAANLGGFGTQVGNQIAGNLIGAGNAQAAAQIAGSNAIGGGLNNAGNSVATNMLIQQLLAQNQPNQNAFINGYPNISNTTGFSSSLGDPNVAV